MFYELKVTGFFSHIVLLYLYTPDKALNRRTIIIVYQTYCYSRVVLPTSQALSVEGVVTESCQYGGCDDTLVHSLQAHRTVRQLCTPTGRKGGTLEPITRVDTTLHLSRLYYCIAGKFGGNFCLVKVDGCIFYGKKIFGESTH